jgi:hypothetical protein
MYIFSSYSFGMSNVIYRALLIISLILSSLLLTDCTNHKKESVTPQLVASFVIRETVNVSDSITIQAELSPAIVTIDAPTNGTIERFNEKPGTTVRKHQILARFNDKTAFSTIRSDKEALKNKIEGLLPTLPKELKIIVPKWIKYYQSISVDQLLPELPTFEYREELNSFQQAGVIELRNHIVSEEIALSKYFVQTTHSGILLRFLPAEKHFYKKGAAFCEIAQTNQGVLKVTGTELPINDTLFWNNRRLLITGIQGTDASANYYTVTTSVTPTATQNIALLHIRSIRAVNIPAAFVVRDTVYVYKNGRAVAQQVKIIRRNHRQVAVTNLSPNDCVLQPLSNLHNGMSVKIHP